MGEQKYGQVGVDFRGADKIDYVRNKAVNLKRGEQKIVIAVHEEAKVIIKKWVNKNTGRLDFGYQLSYSNFYRYLSRSLNIIDVYICKDG